MPVSSIPARARSVEKRLAQRYPSPRTELHWSSPWELLVATILSAQCTDARVNMVTPDLFATWKNVEQMSHADAGEIERWLHQSEVTYRDMINLPADAR